MPGGSGRRVGVPRPDPLTVQVKDPAGAITTVVDLLGRTVSYTDALGTLTTTVYDPAGRVRETTSAPAGVAARATQFTYDAAGRVDTVTAAGRLLADAAYTAAGVTAYCLGSRACPSWINSRVRL